MREIVEAGQVFTGGVPPGPARVTVEDGMIAAVEPSASARHDDRLLVPGFIDWQVNGGGGVLFNDAPDPEGLAVIAAAHRRSGSTGILPTLITDTPDAMARAADAVGRAIASGAPGILGIHWEGPFLNPARKGAHRAELMRRLTLAEADALLVIPGGVTLATVAPECCEPGAIARLVRRGVIVSAGHSEATAAAMRAALAEGLTGVTHLYNAMSQLGPREAGLAGSALVMPALTPGLIADGWHVSDDALRIALRMRGVEGLTLVTDAMPPLGAPGMDRFDLFGRTVEVRDGRCLLADGTLAGAATALLPCLARMTTVGGLPFAGALALVTANPARFLGLDRLIGGLRPGLRADMVLLTPDFTIEAVWCGGVRERP